MQSNRKKHPEKLSSTKYFKGIYKLHIH